MIILELIRAVDRAYRRDDALGPEKDTISSGLSSEDRLLYDKIVVQVKYWLQNPERPTRCLILIRESMSWSIIQDRLKKIKNSSADPVKTKWVTEWEDRISRLEKLSLYINAMRNGIDQNKKMRQILPEVGDYEDSERDLKSSEELVRDLAHQINEELQDISKRLNEEKESISESDLERSGFINLMTRNWLKLQVIGKCPEVSMFKNRLVADMRYPKPSVKIPYEKLLDISVRAIFVVKHLPGASTVQVIEEHIAPPSLSPSPSPSSRVTPIQDFFDDCDYPELAELRSSRLARKSIYIPGKLKNVVRLALKRVERDVFGVGDSPVQVPAAVKPLYHFGAAIFQILGWTDRLTSEENESFSPTNV